MNNLSFEELKALSVIVADSTLLEKVSGGTANDCHDSGSGGSGGCYPCPDIIPPRCCMG